MIDAFYTSPAVTTETSLNSSLISRLPSSDVSPRFSSLSPASLKLSPSFAESRRSTRFTTEFAFWILR